MAISDALAVSGFCLVLLVLSLLVVNFGSLLNWVARLRCARTLSRTGSPMMTLAQVARVTPSGQKRFFTGSRVLCYTVGKPLRPTANGDWLIEVFAPAELSGFVNVSARGEVSLQTVLAAEDASHL